MLRFDSAAVVDGDGPGSRLGFCRRDLLGVSPLKEVFLFLVVLGGVII